MPTSIRHPTLHAPPTVAIERRPKRIPTEIHRQARELHAFLPGGESNVHPTSMRHQMRVRSGP